MKKSKTIYLAGGCFWGVEAYFDRLKGVTFTEVGYANGNIENPTYEQVVRGDATHAEVLKLKYESNLENILMHFFRIVNPFTLNRQGNDIGIQYRSGIYYIDEFDKPIIEKALKEVEQQFKKKSYVEILPLKNYYKAEAYHQKYLDKNKGGYCHVDLNLLRPEERK